MADNVTVDNNALTDYTVASDDDGTAQHQYVKLEWGPDNTQTKVDTGASALPIQDGGNSLTVDGTVAISAGSAVIGTVQHSTTTLVSGQSAPTNAAGNIVASRSGRQRLTLLNAGSVDVYVGPSVVTTANGMKLIPGAALTLHTSAAIQGITASGTGAIHYMEEYT
jgi:hypothetical protein